MGHNLSDQDVLKYAIRSLYQDGFTVAQISRALNVSYNRARRIIKARF